MSVFKKVVRLTSKAFSQLGRRLASQYSQELTPAEWSDAFSRNVSRARRALWVSRFQAQECVQTVQRFEKFIRLVVVSYFMMTFAWLSPNQVKAGPDYHRARPGFIIQLMCCDFLTHHSAMWSGSELAFFIFDPFELSIFIMPVMQFSSNPVTRRVPLNEMRYSFVA